jgi:hypothetical protein
MKHNPFIFSVLIKFWPGKLVIGICLLLMIHGNTLRAEGGTSVGGGGDPLYFYLHATRTKIQAIITEMQRDPQHLKDELCRLPENQLTDEQVSFCQNFIMFYRSAIYNLTIAEKDVPFEVIDTPIIAPGPDGNDIQVVAGTQLRETGVIYVNRSLARHLSPQAMLQIVVHEFGHKIKQSPSGLFLTDLAPVGPFANGRFFLDTIGQSFVQYALDHELIGRQFGVWDQFACVVKPHDGSAFSAVIGGQRQFFNNNPFDYQTGFGFTNQSGTVSVFDGREQIGIRIKIRDKGSCNGATNTRSTLVELYSYQAVMNPGDPRPQEKLEKSQTMADFNPLCTTPAPHLSFQIKGHVFDCSYAFSSGIDY